MVYARTVKSLRVFPFLKGLGNYLNFDKKIVKLFPNFTLRHLITPLLTYNCFEIGCQIKEQKRKRQLPKAKQKLSKSLEKLRIKRVV